jgi:hypothetical protein
MFATSSDHKSRGSSQAAETIHLLLADDVRRGRDPRSGLSPHSGASWAFAFSSRSSSEGSELAGCKVCVHLRRLCARCSLDSLCGAARFTVLNPVPRVIDARLSARDNEPVKASRTPCASPLDCNAIALSLFVDTETLMFVGCCTRRRQRRRRRRRQSSAHLWSSGLSPPLEVIRMSTQLRPRGSHVRAVYILPACVVACEPNPATREGMWS